MPTSELSRPTRKQQRQHRAEVALAGEVIAIDDAVEHDPYMLLKLEAALEASATGTRGARAQAERHVGPWVRSLAQVRAAGRGLRNGEIADTNDRIAEEGQPQGKDRYRTNVQTEKQEFGQTAGQLDISKITDATAAPVLSVRQRAVWEPFTLRDVRQSETMITLRRGGHSSIYRVMSEGPSEVIVGVKKLAPEKPRK